MIWNSFICSPYLQYTTTYNSLLYFSLFQNRSAFAVGRYSVNMCYLSWSSVCVRTWLRLLTGVSKICGLDLFTFCAAINPYITCQFAFSSTWEYASGGFYRKASLISVVTVNWTETSVFHRRFFGFLRVPLQCSCVQSFIQFHSYSICTAVWQVLARLCNTRNRLRRHVDSTLTPC